MGNDGRYNESGGAEQDKRFEGHGGKGAKGLSGHQLLAYRLGTRNSPRPDDRLSIASRRVDHAVLRASCD